MISSTFSGVYDFINRNGHFRHNGLHKVLQYHVMKAAYEEAPQEYAKASPVEWLDKADLPAFLVIHGQRDSLAPVEDARYFSTRLKERSASPLVYFEIPGAQHAFELLPSPRALAAIYGTERFLAHLYSKYLDS